MIFSREKYRANYNSLFPCTLISLCCVTKLYWAVNYYHKTLHLGCCSRPRSGSATSVKEKFQLENYQLQLVNSLVKFLKKTWKIESSEKQKLHYCEKTLERSLKLNISNSWVRVYFMQNKSAHALRKKCPYSELLWSPFFRIRTGYGEIFRFTPYPVQIRENVDQNNSEYGHFLRSDDHYQYHLDSNHITFPKFIL